jgi:hypothetical protein
MLPKYGRDTTVSKQVPHLRNIMVRYFFQQECGPCLTKRLQAINKGVSTHSRDRRSMSTETVHCVDNIDSAHRSTGSTMCLHTLNYWSFFSRHLHVNPGFHSDFYERLCSRTVPLWGYNWIQWRVFSLGLHCLHRAACNPSRYQLRSLLLQWATRYKFIQPSVMGKLQFLLVDHMEQKLNNSSCHESKISLLRMEMSES